MSLRKVAACIRRNKRFLITTHVNPEGDALGAQLAFYRLLKAMGKSAIIVNQDMPAYGYVFLPDINNIVKFRDNLKEIIFDYLVTLDCSSLQRCGKVIELNRHNRPIINIDHHISNKKFAQINWVEPHWSSCAQMIYRLYQELRIPLDKDTAMLLYVGIVTDTGRFRYSNTSSLTHAIASELLNYNLDIVNIHKNLYGNMPFLDMTLLIKVLSGIRRTDRGRIVWVQIKKNLLKKRGVSIDLTENILNFARGVKGVEVAVLFKENPATNNEIRVNFRSEGKVDVNKIAAFFGGGGHQAASGCVMHGQIERIRRIVLKKIKENL